MQRYHYKGRDNKAGVPVDGYLEADSINDVATKLVNQGITPLQIVEAPVKTSPFDGMLNKLNAGKANDDDLILFCRQMFALTKAGVPIIRALNGLADTTRKKSFADDLKTIALELETGRELSKALAPFAYFPKLMVSLVEVGENTGSLDQAFAQISIYLQKEKTTRQKVKGALRYPSFIMVSVIVSIGALNVFVIPTFSGMFSRFGAELPWQTQALISTSKFISANWPYILAGMVLGVTGLRRYIRTEIGELQWNRFKFQLPLVGDIIFRATLSRFARAFAMTTSAGVPVLLALSLAAKGVDNAYMATILLSMRNDIERGESLTRAAMAAKIFTPLVLQMMAVGEETGKVDELILEVADYYEREVDYDLNSLSTVIEPVLIFIIGAIILILALGIFLPMWEMGSVAFE